METYMIISLCILSATTGGAFGVSIMAWMQAAKCSDCKSELVRDLERRLRPSYVANNKPSK